MYKGWCDIVPTLRTEIAENGTPQRLIVARYEAYLYNNVHHLLYVLPSVNIPPANVIRELSCAKLNDILITRSSMNLGGEDVAISLGKWKTL